MTDKEARGEKWCSYCQCFHRPPYPKVAKCRAEEPEYQRKYGMIQDMLDYN